MRLDQKGNKSLIKALIDTNILVSGLFAETGRIAELMNLWVNGGFELVTSEEILDELYRVFHKPSIQKHFNPSEEEIMEYLTIIKERALTTYNLYQTDKIKKDPSDNKFLSCALEARADFIVSGDKHLTEVKNFYGIKIVGVKPFLETIKRQ